MSPAIRVENVGKRYLLQHVATTRSYKTLRESLAGAAGALLRKSNGSSRQEAFWALKDVSFQVQPGEVVGIIGRNGAGKSTLLKILSRITKPTRGEVQIRGRVGSLLEVGTGFHPELTGRENVYLNGSILGMRRREIDSQFDAIVDFAGVDKFLDTPVKRYSSGMYVRLAFSVAAHLNPEVLLVDEVLAVGDAAFQRKCVARMAEIAKGGRTIFFVSHQLPIVSRLCTHACWLDAGSVREYSTAPDVIHAYLADQPEAAVGGGDLRSRSRSQGMRHILQSARATDHLGASTNLVHLGGEFTVEIRVAGMQCHSANDLLITFMDFFGTPVAQAHSYVQSDLDLHRHDIQVIRCTIRDFRMLPGEYRLNLAVGDGTDYIDRIDDALRITVEPRDLYGTGRVPPSRDGYVALNAAWTAAAVGGDGSGTDDLRAGRSRPDDYNG